MVLMTAVPDPTVSIVVPVWRAHHEQLARLLVHLDETPEAETIIATPADELGRYADLRAKHPRVRWVSAPRGRATQMNAGAAIASGRWMVFLHADSRLSSGWPTVIHRAAREERIVGGSYRLVLDSADWRARVLEHGVRLRVRLLGLPYGDQALFVRRDVFRELDGYRDLPLMEDVDLVRRLRRRGTLVHAELPVVTSPRRWEREGWMSRSAQNVALATLYFCGVTPRALARQYFRRRPTAVGMMARAPWTAGKSRLSAHLSASDHAALRSALFHDTLDAIRGVPEADRFVVCEPPETCEAVRRQVGVEIEVIAQQAGDLGNRIQHAFTDLFRLGAARVILVGSDLPDLPPRLVGSAIQALARRGDRVVLGPAHDGGYYLVGLKSPHPELFSGIDWGTAAVLDQTLKCAQRNRVAVHLLAPWRDVDQWTDLERLRAMQSPGAERTRAWLNAVEAPIDRLVPRAAGGAGGGRPV